jgi:uncharacterized protein YtpQ (UPF0354 family)
MSTLLSLDDFMARIAQVTREAGFSVDNYSDVYLFITVNDQSSRLNLHPTYQAYTRSPDRLDEIIAGHLRVLRQLPPPVLTEQTAAEALLPVLQTTQWLVDMQIQEAEPLLYRSFLTGLVIVYVFDLPAARTYVNRTMMQELFNNGNNLDDIHEHALTNLRKRTKSYKLQTHGSFYQTMISCETHEGYAAVQVLLPEIMEQWARRIPGNMLIGIPNRDFIIAFSEKNPVGISSLARQVSKDASSRKYALYGRLLAWRNGEIREYEPLN